MSSAMMFLILTFALYFVGHVQGHATDFTKSANCGRSLAAGSIIMSNTAVSNPTGRTVIVKRGATTLTTGATYTYGETLTASLSSTSGEYVFQVSNAAISSGSCSNTRRANSAITFTAPSSGSNAISVWAGWTTSSGQAVQITNSFTLNPPPSTSSPSRTPTRIPTLQPIAPTVSPAPSFPITRAPTLQPSLTLNPTHGPTPIPTRDPTVADVNDAEANSIDNQAQGVSRLDKPYRVVIGLVIGIGSVAFLYTSSYFYAINHIANPPEERHISEKTFTLTRIFAVFAILLVVACVLLVVRWASENTSDDTGFIGEPEWGEDSFAWHPVLMVAGFFLSQIVAISAWALLPNHYVAKLTHVFFQIAGICSMSFGLNMIWKYKMSRKTPNLTTMHGWLGIAAVSLYAFNFAWGAFMASLTAYYPDSVFRKVFSLKEHHKHIGTMALILTSLALLTGIMDQLPQGSCFYPAPSSGVYSGEEDAAVHYPETPQSCRIAHGMGIAIVATTLMIYLAVMYRGDSFGLQRNRADAVVPEGGFDPVPTHATSRVQDIDVVYTDAQVVHDEEIAASAPPPPHSYMEVERSEAALTH